mmetsp:Transcript_24797/g.59044  ORF Transcript_24797/g.59044 Transcript_24797/m.59044 type:complete len:132 (-) Transcript_24797:145-540(-)|eukprot:CAMPEP_0180150992 /NCGR_PEP_ID=MMETSP0986-20121125/21854_1 /TAXON_ID=697907 /ORGANISM="non described non described, Strain CCMP2293" /LENGTH=131 /DNA_ID=CAMNT_0022098183 /DNA_START=59 /DNA_END=454 /DNA_ORIENTATION=+
MAPSSPTIAATRKPSPLTVIADGIQKKHEDHKKIRARMAAHTVIHGDACATEIDEDSVESPEEICGLSGDKWDVDEACWSGNLEEPLPANQGIKLYEKNQEVASSGQSAVNNDEDYACTDDGDELLLLLGV